jgi:type I restriction enzyme M protein
MGIVQQQLFYIERGETRKHRNRKIHNQYFTPEFAVEKALSFISAISISNVIDPAVGNGVFLKSSSKKWEKAELFGVDIDKEVIAALKKSNLPNSYFVSADSLLRKTWQLPKIKQILSKGGFDLVVGNPPFSSWFQRVESEEILSNYELAKSNGNLKRSQAIEILFLEIFLKLAKVAGFIVIVLPDGILSNPQYQYVREFILKSTMGGS